MEGGHILNPPDLGQKIDVVLYLAYHCCLEAYWLTILQRLDALTQLSNEGENFIMLLVLFLLFSGYIVSA